MTDSTTPSPGPLLIEGGLLLEAATGARTADILIEAGVIREVGEGIGARLRSAGGLPPGLRIIDARECHVVPGFIASHFHSHDALLRGLFEPMTLEAWLAVGVPVNYPPRSREEIRARALLAALESLRSGITTVQDLCTLHPFDESHVGVVLDAYDEVGIRVEFALQVADAPGQYRVPHWDEVIPPELRRSMATSVKPLGHREAILDLVDGQIEHWRGRHARTTWGLGAATPENCSEAFLQALTERADRLDCRIYTHLYESKSTVVNARAHFAHHGGSLVAWMDAIGVLGPRLTMAHCVWLQPVEIEAIARAGARVALNSASNLKTLSGVAPIRELFEAGVGVGLGTDNSSCSDAQDMFTAMKLLALLSSASHGLTGRPDAREAFAAATTGSAAGIGQADRLGRIAPGYRADLTLIDRNDPALQPVNDPIRQLVYSASVRSVKTVIVDGEVVVEDARSTRIDERELFREVAGLMPGLRADLAAIIERGAPVAPYLSEVHRRNLAVPVGIDRYIARPVAAPGR